MYDYIHEEAIKDRILARYRFDFWLETDEVISVKQQTCSDHDEPSQWVSIGIDNGSRYEPIFDIFVLDINALHTLKQRVKKVCMELGGSTHKATNETEHL